MPIISIYILGHILGDLKELVVYVRRRYLDYDDQVIEQKDQLLQEMVRMLMQAGISKDDIAQKLSLSPQEVEKLI